MSRIDINTNITNIVKKYLTSFSESIISRFYSKSDIDNKMANIDTRSEIGSSLDYGLFFPSIVTGLATGNYFAFDKICTNNNLKQNGSYFVLKSNKTYQIKAYISSKYSFGIYNVDDDTLISNLSYGYSNGTDATGDIAAGSITTTKDTNIGVKVTAVTPLSVKNSYPECSFLEIQEVGRTVVLDPAQQIDKDTGIQDTPIGHIMSFMGINAPEHYLICDGSIYNIVDKRDLANYFLTEFGSIDYFGGDGVTTFAVPDMRESVQVGSGQNTTKTIAAHDIYDVGQFKDDQMQKITGGSAYYSYGGGSTSGAFKTAILNGNSGPALTSGGATQYSQLSIDSSLQTRTGTSTHGKQIGVLYCIKFEKTYFMNYAPQYAGFDSTVLFNGTASANGDYELTDDVTKYDMLLVYSKNNLTPNHGTVSNTIIVSDIDNTCTNQYVNSADAGQDAGYGLFYFFPNYKTLRVSYVFLYGSWNSGAKIYKIIGIKSGTTVAGSDFTVTDAEADATITQVWNEVCA